MKIVNAFFVSLFGVLGALVALGLVVLLLVGIYSKTDEESFSAKVKLLADADGHRKQLSSSTPVILQLAIDGKIGKDHLTGKKIENLLLESREDEFKKDRVKAILLTINSPGGGVTDSDTIYRHLKRYKEKYNVPIYAYVDGLCASGGYYIACAADKIFASDVSLIGSIGVLSWPPFLNAYDTLKKIGIEALTLSAGKGKDEMNPFRPWHPDEQQDYQRIINYYYDSFVSIVCAARPQVDLSMLVDTYGAKIYPAPVAVQHQLIDRNGASREDTLRALAQAAGLETYQVIGFETKSWWQKVINEKSPLLTGKIKHEFDFPLHEGNPFSYLYVP